MTKQKLRSKFIEDSYTHDNMCAEWATGTGKTSLAISLIHLHLTKSGKFLFLVPEIPLIQNAKNEFGKFGKLDLLGRGDFACYASLSKFENNEYDLIVLDEVHQAKSDLRTDILSRIKTKKRIALSASIDDDTKIKLSELGEWKINTITLTQAFEWGLLPEPDVNVNYLDFDETVKRNKVQVKGKSYNLTDKDYYKNLCDRISYFREIWENEGNEYAKNRMNFLGGARMKFMANCKTEAVRQLINSLKDERFICFAGSVEQAQQLGGKNVCSSRKTSKQNQELIDSFNKGEVNSLFAKNMLQEGVNLFNTKHGIIIQLQRKERYFVQTLGRLLRYKDRPQLHLFLMRNSIDDTLLRNATYRNKTIIKN